MQRTDAETETVDQRSSGPTGRPTATARARWRRLTSATAAVTLALVGCGTDIGSLLATSFQAAARQALDSALTDFASGVTPTDTTNGGNGNANDNTNDNGNGTTDPIVAGEAVYTDNGCAACHCADASGGCALAAPSLVGLDAAVLADVVTGAANHPTSVGLTDQQQADLIAYLSTLP